MIHTSWLKFIPTIYVKVLAGMWVSSFAMTTLDTTNRLARYCLTEMALPLKDSATGLYKALTNRWVASLIPAALGLWLAATGNWLVIWGSFGAANQLIASIALMTGAAYIAKRLKSSFANVAVIPAWLLWITVTAALIWFIVVVQPVAIAKTPGPGWAVMIITIVMFLLNFVFIYDFVKSKSYKVSE
jgi:carbon starvation protein